MNTKLLGVLKGGVNYADKGEGCFSLNLLKNDVGRQPAHETEVSTAALKLVGGGGEVSCGFVKLPVINEVKHVVHIHRIDREFGKGRAAVLPILVAGNNALIVIHSGLGTETADHACVLHGIIAFM